jgi:class 3 adenylate cyclase/predicted ATPase
MSASGRVSAMDVADWLRKLGLEQYEPAFRTNDVDAEVLPRLTADDLISIGVTSVGHRRRLLDAIAALAGGAPTSRDAPVGADAERRQLTVMFCDLVGSTELSVRIDPEDLREVIGAYHCAVAEIVTGFDGFVSRYMGDGVLVYFGYPQAHEDDAERAVRAGLGVIDAVRRLDIASVKLRTRVGIATGLVVVGDLIGGGAVQERSVVGETPNLAARLQALAEPDTVVIAAGTRRLLGALFEYHDLGNIELKGIAAPVPVWQVLRASVVASRFEALRGSALTRLVGRDEEIDLLLRRWARAKAGGGQVVLLSGEAGLGKSRMTAELEERLHSEPHLHLRYFCSPYHQDSALFPFIEQLGRASGFGREDPPSIRLEKLAALLAGAAPLDKDLDKDFAFLADLLSLPASERHPLPNLSPQRKKERTLEALIRQLEALSQRQPLVMVLEDAHWIDPTSRELLDLVVSRVSSLPVLLIVTSRPDFQPPWTGQPQVWVLALTRLDQRERIALAIQVAGKALPDEVVAQIADRTDGVPLFVEELTKGVLESGLLREEADRYVLDDAFPPLAIPSTLHDSLLARLDRLAPVRLVAQIGAAIGREFSYGLLRTVSRLPEGELQAALTRLVASELVFQRGTPPDAVYSFKHVLVQDAAHGSLLRDVRRQVHAQIAEALETYSPSLTDSQPELLAQHYTEAGLIEKSVAYWGKAGRKSAARSAMVEAAAQLQKALDQLALLPDSPDRQRQELELCSVLGGALINSKGVTSEAGGAFARARELWEQLGSPSKFLHVPYGQSRYYAHRGELVPAQRLAEDLLRVSRQRNDVGGLVLGHFSCGRNAMFAGRFASSRSHLEEVLGLYNPISHRPLVHQAAIHPDISARAYLAVVLFCLGFPDRALALSRAAIAEARELAYLPSLATSLTLGCELVSLLGDDATLDELADQLTTVTIEQGSSARRNHETIFRGWLEVGKGNVTNGISLLRSTLANRSGQVWTPHYISLLASACEIADDNEAPATLLDDALQIVERTGERWFAAELNRHKGQLLLRQGDSALAEELYHSALSIAQEQEAKLWELRAAASLARLRRDQGRRAEARDLLAPVYDWFTEGFGTPDLKQAKALLDELGGD